MRLTLTIIFAFVAISAFSQDSTSVKKIKLNEKQKLSLAEFDQRSQAIQQQFQINNDQRTIYLKAILEKEGVDVSKVVDVKVDDGKILLTLKKPE